ncbi:MAG TPA: YbhB/YbcL family Raf kinase inhibitor-like protein [Polyangiales bacterium]|nr:YbhB/YbcL family Raf kinase inhibitor-like protein [Polyangiales bacterium]
MTLTLESPAFRAGAAIPTEYTADGDDKSPPLRWSGVPENAKTLALIMEDPDAPSGTFVHWLAFNIPATIDHLNAGTEHRGDYTDGTLQGKNGFDRVGYGGPRPPRGQTHDYVFRFYALDDRLGLEPGVSKEQIERAMQGHVLASAELRARYGRS